MDFQSGERVYMLLHNETVAIGCVCRIDPDATCGGTKIGIGNVSVLVEECLKDVILPFSTMDTTSLQSSLWSSVRWPKGQLRSLAREVNLASNSRSNDCDEEIDHVSPMIMDVVPITSPEFERSVRESWKNQRVLLKDETMMQTINKGLIFYVFPDDCVNFYELGDESVGVIIERDNGNEENVLETHSVNLMRWPINQITMLDGSPLQRYAPIDGVNIGCAHVPGEANGINVDHEVNGTNVSRGDNSTLCSTKRCYTFINRIKKQRSNPAMSVYMSLDSVKSVSCIDCCSKKCCQLVDRDVVMQIRQEFWGQSQKSRTNYIYDVLSICYDRQNFQKKVTYQFRLNGISICCKAWYEMHGIPKTSFYRYKEKFELGARQYVHGNTCILRRGLDHTSRARSILDDFVDKNSERMPHKSRTLLDGSRENQLVIPSTYKQVDILNEVNTTLEQQGCVQKISKSSFSRIWNNEYPHVSLTKTSEFSKCTLCSSIKARLEAKPSLQERLVILKQREIHMAQQKSCRSLYYAWRTLSETQPQKYLCIIHDKMDQKKTAIPRLRVVPKNVDSGYNLQVALIGMITHGHGEGYYGHFVLHGLWPFDPNLTIGSIVSCLHNLERQDQHPLGDLATSGLPRSNTSLLNALSLRDALDYHNLVDGTCSSVQTLLRGNENNPIINMGSSFHRLPENLLLQLDNCAGENKNRYLFAFLSLLVAKGIFKTIQLGFLMVGHTHEDIDAMFSRFSEKLRVSQTYTLPHLMDTLRTSSTTSPAPFLLGEVPDFKKYCDGYICDGQDALVGHSKPLQFRFFMQGETPVMQYKAHVGVSNWSGSIPIWKKDAEGNTMLPQGNPPLVPMEEFVKAHEDVILGLKNYVRFWQNLGNGSFVPRYYRPVIDYWTNVIQELEKPTNISHTTCYENFWPKSLGFHHVDANVAIQQEEIERFIGLEEYNDHYCGPQREKPREEFNPTLDVKKGDFLLLQPSDPEIYPVWLATALLDVDKDPSSPNYQKLFIQYWAPCVRKSGLTDAEAYANCWKGFWVVNDKEQKIWENVDAIVWSWRSNKKGPFVRIKIPKRHAIKAKACLGLLEVEQHGNELDGDSNGE